MLHGAPCVAHNIPITKNSHVESEAGAVCVVQCTPAIWDVADPLPSFTNLRPKLSWLLTRNGKMEQGTFGICPGLVLGARSHIRRRANGFLHASSSEEIEGQHIADTQ